MAIKVALHSEIGERRWVRQAVMGVLRWRDLPGTRSSTGTLRSLSTTEVIRYFPFKKKKLNEKNEIILSKFDSIFWITITKNRYENIKKAYFNWNSLLL